MVFCRILFSHFGYHQKSIFLHTGNNCFPVFRRDELRIIIEGTKLDKIIWEAPQKNQQTYFILKFGANVNLGNIAPDEITALETMRLGLRGDTMGKVNLG